MLAVTWANDSRGRSVFWLPYSCPARPSGRPLMINSVSRRGHRQILLATFSRPITAFPQLMFLFHATRRRNFGLAPAAGWAEDAGALGRFAAGFDVAHGGAGVLVPGLGHDELERAFGVAEVGRGAVPELVEIQPGVVVQQDAAAVIAEAGPAGVRADVGGALAGGPGRVAFGQEQRSARTRSAAGQAQLAREQAGGAGVPVHPLDRAAFGPDGRRRFSRSRSCTSISRISAARAAVSYSIRRRVFSRSGMSRPDSSRWTAVLGPALVSSEFSLRRSQSAGTEGRASVSWPGTR